MDWCRALAAAIHGNPESAVAGKGWRGSLAVAVLPDDGLAEPFVVLTQIEDGRVLDIRPLEDEDEIDEVEPDYVAKGGYLTWKRFIRGEYDPIEALLQRKIRFEGDLQPIAERAQFKRLFWEMLAQVPTTFADERDARS
jgi:putative sterol carrier protein